jgi:hypothetical protein
VWWGVCCRGCRGNLGVVSPATFNISYSTCIIVFSSQILFSLTNPFPLGLVIVIMSPRSCTCSLQRAAALYTSYLLVYSVLVNDILQRISPLCFLIPSYSCLLLDFEGHSNTKRCSPGGAFTLMHPVTKAKSFPSWAERAVFHWSRSPLYLLAWISLVISLCR